MEKKRLLMVDKGGMGLYIGWRPMEGALFQERSTIGTSLRM
jgi:hypothetical protein